MKTSKLYTSIQILIVSLFSGLANSHELETTIGVSLEYDDNVFLKNGKSNLLEEGEKVPDLIRSPSIAIDYSYDFSNVKAKLAYEAIHMDYRDDTFSERTDITGEGTINWSIVENRFNWNLLHSQSRTKISNQQAETPRNLADRSMLSTGFDAVLLSGLASSLNLNANYTETSTDPDEDIIINTLQDNQLIQTSLSYDQNLNLNTNFGVTLSTSGIEYDSDLFDYDQDTAYITLGRTGRSFSWQFNLGYNRSRPSVGEDQSGSYHDIYVSWTKNQIELTLKSNRQLTDSNIGLSQSSNFGDSSDNGDGNLGKPGGVERYHHEIYYTQSFNRIKLQLTVAYDEQDFLVVKHQEQTVTLATNLRYNMSDRHSIAYDYRRVTNDFESADILDDEFVTNRHSLSFNYQINDSWQASLTLSDSDREFDSIGQRDYANQRATLSTRYTF